MSLDLVGWAFDQGDVPTTQRSVLVRLAWHTDRNTLTCYPSLTHLAKKTGFNRSTVARSISWLEGNGYVERMGLLQGRSMTYRLLVAERNQSHSATSRRERLVAERTTSSRRAQPEVVAQRNPKEESREPSMNRQSSRKRPKDEAVEYFKIQYEKNREIPHGSTNGKTGGYVQLAALRKRLDISARASPKGWAQAVANYFHTPQATYTLADLCVRYDTFLKSALDRFNKPVEGRNGTNTESRFKRNMRVASIAD